MLTGVDITSWGADLPGAPRLGTLVKAILRARAGAASGCASPRSIRVEADPDLLDALAGEPRLMPHLHLSLQAGRRHDPEAHEAAPHAGRRHRASAQTVRRLRPDIVFGADLIAGFPTETEAMFARSLDLVEDCGLTHLHVFPFSPRPGTPAARMPQVDARRGPDRARRSARERARRRCARHLDAQVGRTPGCARRAKRDRAHRGFHPRQAACRTEPGHIVEVAIAGHDGRRLIAA